MATWGTLGAGWQYASGAVSETSVPPKLVEAFGGDSLSFSGFGNTGAFVGGRPGFGNPARSTGAYVGGPRGFSNAQGSSGAITFAGDSSNIAMQELQNEVPQIFSLQALNSDLAKEPFGIGGCRSLSTSSEATTAMAGSLHSGDPCWVTVFGFPDHSAELVRQQLEVRCGPIVEARHGDGNFMHVRFQNTTAASQCLAHNGRSLLGGVLIGCVPCTSGLLSAPNRDQAGLPPGIGRTGFQDDLACISGGGFGAYDMGAQWSSTVGEPQSTRNLPWRAGGLGNQGSRVRRDSFLHRLLAWLFDM